MMALVGVPEETSPYFILLPFVSGASNLLLDSALRAVGLPGDGAQALPVFIALQPFTPSGGRNPRSSGHHNPLDKISGNLP